MAKCSLIGIGGESLLLSLSGGLLRQLWVNSREIFRGADLGKRSVSLGLNPDPDTCFHF